MKKMYYLIPSLAVMLIASCSSNNTNSVISSNSSSVSNEVYSTNSTSTSKLYDTNGNEIKSGSSKVSFKYGNQTTNKTISAAYLIDGVSVNITSGEYISASNNSDQVVFLVVNGGSLNITGTSSS